MLLNGPARFCSTHLSFCALFFTNNLLTVDEISDTNKKKSFCHQCSSANILSIVPLQFLLSPFSSIAPPPFLLLSLTFSLFASHALSLSPFGCPAETPIPPSLLPLPSTPHTGNLRPSASRDNLN